MKLRVYEVSHGGAYLGGKSIVVAPNKIQAIRLTCEALEADKRFTLDDRLHVEVVQEFELTKPRYYHAVTPHDILGLGDDLGVNSLVELLGILSPAPMLLGRLGDGD